MTQKDQPELPASGGSYTRQKNGQLKLSPNPKAPKPKDTQQQDSAVAGDKET